MVAHSIQNPLAKPFFVSYPPASCCAQVYTIYSILFIVFIILIIVTAFITVALTYFQLAVEDHRWWWRSVMCGGSTGEPYSSYHSATWSSDCRSASHVRAASRRWFGITAAVQCFGS